MTQHWQKWTLASIFVVALVAGLSLGSRGAFATAYDPATDPYSMKSLTNMNGASAWWNAGYTGAGVDIALIDTGVSPVQGLATAGKLIHGPDLSLESQASNLRNLDTNGHGTFMAGLIAGKDSTLTAPYAPTSAYRGMAPDARIVSLKVATADGGTDVSQVIAAINWVVQHKNDNGMDIRVINLSYGTNSTQSSTTDPLSYAAEQAWKHGIVVVAAVGNTGDRAEEGVAMPAANRYIIAVGGYDTRGTTNTSDDLLGDYSARVDGGRGADFVAPGSHMQGLRVQNSFLEPRIPRGRSTHVTFAEPARHRRRRSPPAQSPSFCRSTRT